MQYVWIILGAVVVVLGVILVFSNQPSVIIDQQVRLTLTEWKIVPNTIEMVAGPARFIVFNMGTLPHALAITGMVNGQKFERQLPAVPAGQVHTFLVELPRGEFTLYDSLNCRDPIRGSCERKTMVSKITVR
jgi:hypothetical protein